VKSGFPLKGQHHQLSFKTTLGHHSKPTSTVNPQKPNLPQQFIRTTRTPDKQNRPKVPNFIQKFCESMSVSGVHTSINYQHELRKNAVKKWVLI